MVVQSHDMTSKLVGSKGKQVLPESAALRRTCSNLGKEEIIDVNTFKQSTVWDEDGQGIFVQDSLLKQLALGTNNSIGENWVSTTTAHELFDDKPLWDEELPNAFDGYGLEDVIWDDEVVHELNTFDQAVYEECVVPITEERECEQGPMEDLTGKEIKPTIEFSLICDTSFQAEIDIDSAVLDRECHGKVVWDEMPSASVVCDDIMEFDLVPSAAIVWDQEQDATGDTMTIEEKSIAIKMDCSLAVVFFTHFKWCSDLNHKKGHVLAVQELNHNIESLGNGEEMKGDVCSFEKNKLATEIYLDQHGAYLVHEDRKLIDGTYTVGLLNQELSKKIVREADMLSDLVVHNTILQQLALGRQYLDSETTKTILLWRIWMQDIEGKLENVANAETKITVELNGTIHLSVRRQWDPGISTATAWGQAVFRGAGNVTTRLWAERSPSEKKPSKDYILQHSSSEGTIEQLKSETDRGVPLSSGDLPHGGSDSGEPFARLLGGDALYRAHVPVVAHRRLRVVTTDEHPHPRHIPPPCAPPSPTKPPPPPSYQEVNNLVQQLRSVHRELCSKIRGISVLSIFS